MALDDVHSRGSGHVRRVWPRPSIWRPKLGVVDCLRFSYERRVVLQPVKTHLIYAEGAESVLALSPHGHD